MNCSGFQGLFLRRRKIVVQRHSDFVILDTGGESRTVDLDSILLGLDMTVAVDSQTVLIYTPGDENKLTLVDIGTGEVKETQVSPISLDVKMVTVGDWIYSVSHDYPVRVRKDLSGETRPKGEGREATRQKGKGSGGTIELFEVMGDKMVCLQKGKKGDWKLGIWDTETLKLLKKIDLPDDFDLMKKMDDVHVFLASYRFQVAVVNIETGRITKSSFPSERLHINDIEIFPAGTRSPIFAADEGGIKADVRIFFLTKAQKLSNGVQNLTQFKNTVKMLALDENHVFIIDLEGNFETWEFRAEEKKLLCRGSLESMVDVSSLPLSPAENRGEDSRITRELEKHNLPVPRDILGVITGFI